MPPAGEDLPDSAQWLLVTLREGKNREIRRMVEALGHKVLLLRRIRVGPVHLGTIGLGAFRELTDEEVTALYAAGKEAEARDAASPAD